MGFRKPAESQIARSGPLSATSGSRMPASFDRDVENIEEVPVEEVEMNSISNKRKSDILVASGSRHADTILGSV